jgi:hypothetical protein
MMLLQCTCLFPCLDATAWTAIFTGLATCIIAIYAIRQYRQSRISSEKQLRAYVSVEITRAELNDHSITPPELNLRNHGQTPAYQVVSWIEGGIGNIADWDFYQLPPEKWNHARFTLHPHSGSDISKVRIFGEPAPLDLEQVRTDDAEGLCIFYWGEVWYEDAFHEKRCTPFRFKFEIDWFGVPPKLSDPIYCEDGNNAT